jgi:hypothetical protein
MRAAHPRTEERRNDRRHADLADSHERDVVLLVAALLSYSPVSRQSPRQAASLQGSRGVPRQLPDGSSGREPSRLWFPAKDVNAASVAEALGKAAFKAF